ncbi:MAG TPA: SRPBCC family protein [Chitinophagaceae bacterium]|nr:SRPBCC family protein [Chitinophagaceae bacterium]
MNIALIILLVIAGIIALLLIMALFMKKEHYVKREIIINAPRQKVFDYVKLLKNQEQFSKWAAADADRNKEFKGTDGTVGFIYAWSGNKKAGEGQKEIKNIIEGKRIETEMRFVKPMAAIAHVIMETESLSGDQTRVYWSNRSALKYPLNIMVPLVEKMVAKEMDISLSNLKNILEK